MYVMALSVSKLREMYNEKRVVVDRYDPLKQQHGYQRGVEDDRIKEITTTIDEKLNLLKSKKKSDDLLPPLLPGAIILNVRKKANEGRSVGYDPKSNAVRVPENVELYVIDGQHRIEGLIRSQAEEDVEVPIVVVDGLNTLQEAGQFLIINTKQKRVKPGLQLRVLYDIDPSNTHALADKLGVDDWKMPALTIVMALNDTPGSPWRNRIRRPGSLVQKKGKWTPMTEENFVDTLRFFCKSSPVASLPSETKRDLLLEYWDAISEIYPDAFHDQKGRLYKVCKPIGVGALNNTAPVIFHLRNVTKGDYSNILSNIAKKFKLDSFWMRRTGKVEKYGSNQKEYMRLAFDLLKVIEGFSYFSEKTYVKLSRKLQGKPIARTLERAYSTLRPVMLRPLKELKESKYGCYVLVNLGNGNPSVYVGRSVNVKQRVKQHPSTYQLFNCHDCDNQREMEDMERALFHLVDAGVRDNTSHPPPSQNCPFE